MVVRFAAEFFLAAAVRGFDDEVRPYVRSVEGRVGVGESPSSWLSIRLCCGVAATIPGLWSGESSSFTPDSSRHWEGEPGISSSFSTDLTGVP